MVVRVLYAVERIAIETIVAPPKVEESKLEAARRTWGGVA
jgi:hypothetical protein